MSGEAGSTTVLNIDTSGINSRSGNTLTAFDERKQKLDNVINELKGNCDALEMKTAEGIFTKFGITEYLKEDFLYLLTKVDIQNVTQRISFIDFLITLYARKLSLGGDYVDKLLDLLGFIDNTQLKKEIISFHFANSIPSNGYVALGYVLERFDLLKEYLDYDYMAYIIKKARINSEGSKGEALKIKEIDVMKFTKLFKNHMEDDEKKRFLLSIGLTFKKGNTKFPIKKSDNNVGAITTPKILGDISDLMTPKSFDGGTIHFEFLSKNGLFRLSDLYKALGKPKPNDFNKVLESLSSNIASISNLEGEYIQIEYKAGEEPLLSEFELFSNTKVGLEVATKDRFDGGKKVSHVKIPNRFFSILQKEQQPVTLFSLSSQIIQTAQQKDLYSLRDIPNTLELVLDLIDRYPGISPQVIDQLLHFNSSLLGVLDGLPIASGEIGSNGGNGEADPGEVKLEKKKGKETKGYEYYDKIGLLSRLLEDLGINIDGLEGKTIGHGEKQYKSVYIKEYNKTVLISNAYSKSSYIFNGNQISKIEQIIKDEGGTAGITKIANSILNFKSVRFWGEKDFYGDGKAPILNNIKRWGVEMREKITSTTH